MDFNDIYQEALEAGKNAEQDFLSKYGEPMYCGFAWVEISNARTPFVKWCKANNVGSKHWKKGWSIWNPTRNMTQSMDLKEAGSGAFAKVLRNHGIDAYSCSRAD